MTLSLIVALDRNGLIGRNGGLPWRLPADLKHFKETTMHKPVIMGRRTCDSLPKALPGRRNLVLTQNRDFRREGFDIYHDKATLLESVQHVEESMVIGGAGIYQLFWSEVTRAYVTLVDGTFDGDTWFPQWPLAGWRLASSSEQPADEQNPYPMKFMVYEKVENN